MQLAKFVRWTLATTLGGAVLLGDVAVPPSQSGAGTLPNPAVTLGTAAHAGRSGGRSGGGSISRPASPGRSSRSHASTSSGRSSMRSLSPYSATDRRQTDHDVRSRVVVADVDGNRSSGDSAHDWLVFLLVGGVLVTVSGCKAVTAIAEAATAFKEVNFDSLQRLNDIVTVTTLQVAIHVDADHDVQTALSTLGHGADTDQPEGLLTLLQNSALAVLRAADHWCYGNGTAKMLSTRDQATACFNAASLEERSMFSGETLVHRDRQLDLEPESSPVGDLEYGQYVVVTFIVASEADMPLFRNIQSKTDLQAALTRLAAMPVEDLLRVEVLWTPQAAPAGLTQEDLLLDYTDLVLL